MDRAVWLFGTELENAIESINEKNPKTTNSKRERVVRKWLRLEQEYRSPQAVQARKSSGKGSLGDRVREEAGLKASGVPENDLLGGVRRGVRRR